MQPQQETLAEVVTKATPPVGISLATVFGYNVSDLVLWATLIYTVMMVGHKAYMIWRDIKGGKYKNASTRQNKRKD